MQSNRKIIKFLFVFLVFGICIGIYLYLNEESIIKDIINNELVNKIFSLSNIKPNSFLWHFIVFSILSILSVILIGVPISFMYFLYEGISIGFLLSIFVKYNMIKGFLFGFIFVLLNKFIYLIIMIYFLTSSYNYFFKVIKNFKGNKNNIIVNFLFKCIIVILFIFINDLILYFFFDKIIGVFSFLI